MAHCWISCRKTRDHLRGARWVWEWGSGVKHRDDSQRDAETWTALQDPALFWPVSHDCRACWSFTNQNQDSTSFPITSKPQHSVSLATRLQTSRRHWRGTSQWWPSTLTRTMIEYVGPSTYRSKFHKMPVVLLVVHYTHSFDQLRDKAAISEATWRDSARQG